MFSLAVHSTPLPFCLILCVFSVGDTLLSPDKAIPLAEAGLVQNNLKIQGEAMEKVLSGFWVGE